MNWTATRDSVRLKLLALALLVVAAGSGAAPAEAGGEVELGLQMSGVVSGDGLIVIYDCTALSRADGNEFPDPHFTRVSCALRSDTRTWPAPDVESVLVPGAATASAARVPFAHATNLTLCGVAEAQFADGHVAVDERCLNDVTELNT